MVANGWEYGVYSELSTNRLLQSFYDQRGWIDGTFGSLAVMQWWEPNVLEFVSEIVWDESADTGGWQCFHDTRRIRWVFVLLHTHCWSVGQCLRQSCSCMCHHDMKKFERKEWCYTTKNKSVRTGSMKLIEEQRKVTEASNDTIRIRPRFTLVLVAYTLDFIPKDNWNVFAAVRGMISESDRNTSTSLANRCQRQPPPCPEKSERLSSQSAECKSQNGRKHTTGSNSLGQYCSTKRVCCADSQLTRNWSGPIIYLDSLV